MWNRRSFAKVLAVGTVGATTGLAAPRQDEQRSRGVSRRPIVKPKRLSTGDTVGMIAPASAAWDSDTLQYAREQFEALGLKVRVGQHAHERHGYLAGRDEDRAADVNAMFADEKIDGIVCFDGGWGSPRILPLLDYGVIARHPKVFVGFSDVTPMLIAIHQRTGLVTYHGPVGVSPFEPYTVENFRRVIMTAEPAGVLAPPPKRKDVLVDRTNRIVKIAGGRATARLVGGNLTMIAATMGTPYEIETDGAILFLEDVREKLYRVDRMLTQLSLGGKLSRLAGVAFGRCTDCGADGPSFSLEELLRHHLGARNIPVLTGLSFGHIEQKLVLPVGTRATLDADAGTLSLDEAAVV